MTRGEEALRDRLVEQAEAVALHTRRLAEARRLRNLLIGKARAAGWSVRQIEQFAGVSNVRVSQVASPEADTQ